jgi:hypothetical protein
VGAKEDSFMKGAAAGAWVLWIFLNFQVVSDRLWTHLAKPDIPLSFLEIMDTILAIIVAFPVTLAVAAGMAILPALLCAVAGALIGEARVERVQRGTGP